MNIKKKYGKNFTTALNKMKEKYGEEFELINGIHETQLSDTDFIDNFTRDNLATADNTIDANANVSSKDIQSLLKEKGKSQDKLNAFNKIFYELQKKYGIKTAREWLELEFGPYLYLHDAPSATYFPYCYAYDLTRLATEGLFFIEVEFLSEEDAQNFVPPDWFGANVSEDERYTNSFLSKCDSLDVFR